MPQPRIYLDNAATSWPKPEAVYAAVERYQRQLGAPAGRGVYVEAMEVQKLVEHARAGAAQLLGVSDPRRIVFCYSGTDALNQAITGVLRDGAHVVTTVVEHNSVLRPLRTLEEAGRVSVTRVGCDSAGRVDPDDIRRAFRPETQLAIVTHASNVTGTIQLIADIARIVHERNALLLVDAAQTAGELPLNVAEMGIDLLATPGHKGLQGPLGTGLLYMRPGVELEPLRRGGTGSRSESDRQPEELPDRFEAGNLNVPGLVGLGAGVNYVRERSIDSIRRKSIVLTERLLAGLIKVPGVRVIGPPDAASRVGIVSITVAGYEPQELAMLLDASAHIQTRAGLHCAPLAHRAMGTLDDGGTLRLSLGCFTTEADIDTAVAAIGSLAVAAKS